MPQVELFCIEIPTCYMWIVHVEPLFLWHLCDFQFCMWFFIRSMVRVKKFDVRQKFFGNRFTKTDGRKCASTVDATISNLGLRSASIASKRKLSDAQSNQDEHFCVNKSDIELGKWRGELVGWWSVSCDNEGDTPTATGHRGSAAGTAQNQGGVCRELGSKHN